MTIKDIINVPLCRCYMFEEDEFMCHFTDDMIEGLVEEKTKPEIIFKIGDKIRLKGTDSAGTVIDIIVRNQLLIILSDGSKIIEWPENVVLLEEFVEETKTEPKFKVGDSVEVLKSGNTYTISQVKFNGKEFVYTLSNNGSTVSCFSENELKPIRVINIAIKPHNVRGDEIIKMLEELGGTNTFSFDGSDHNCVNPFAYYIDKDNQIHGGGIGFLRRNGYEINTLEELKKKEYPKTYEECCYVLGFENTEMVFEDDYRDINPPKEQWKRLGLMNQLNKLLICRDAYWKIAGERMGLGESWKPDYTKERYIIRKWIDNIVIGYRESGDGERFILEFPTEEMRDAFYENFKELIENCKEML